jgi:hypothetical protein
LQILLLHQQKTISKKNTCFLSNSYKRIHYFINWPNQFKCLQANYVLVKKMLMESTCIRKKKVSSTDSIRGATTPVK